MTARHDFPVDLFQRRSLIRSFLLGAYAVFAICSMAEAQAQARKDTAVIGIQQEPSGLDPTSEATASIGTIIGVNVLETLTTLDQRGAVMPLLAERWRVSDDGRVWTFSIVQGAKFSDGQALDAGVIKSSFERAMAPDSTNPQKPIFAAIEKVEAPEAATLVVTLKQSDSFFLFNVAQPATAIMHPSGVANAKVSPVGSGPYRLKNWTKADRLVLERNPSFRQVGFGGMREITYRFISDPAAAAAALLAGDIDAFPNVPAPEMMKQFERDRRFKVATGSTEGEVMLVLNNAKKPLDDVRVRRAINHLIDRKAIIDGAMFGYGTPIGSHFPPQNEDYIDLTGRYPLDAAAAKKLLAEAGFADGLDITLRLPPFPYARRSGEVLQSQLAKGGVRAKIENVEWGFWIGEVFKGNYDMTVIAHVEPNDFRSYSRGKSYYWGYQSADYDKLMNDLRATADRTQQRNMKQQAQRMISEDAIHGFLFQLPQLGVYKAGLDGYWVNSPGNVSPVSGLRWVN